MNENPSSSEPQTIIVKTGGKGKGCMIAALIGGLVVLAVVIGCIFLMGKAVDAGGKFLEENSGKIIDEAAKIQQEELRRQGKHGEADAIAKEVEAMKGQADLIGENVADALKLALPGGQKAVLEEAHAQQLEALEEMQAEHEKILEEMRKDHEKEMQEAPAAMKAALEQVYEIQVQTTKDAYEMQVEMLKEVQKAQAEAFK